MHLVTRAQWGAKPPKSPLKHIASTKGVKVHYEGAPVPADLAKPEKHSQCAGRVRSIQASHLANTKEKYSDIAYSYVVCPHGHVFEGRGLHKRQGANGNQQLNLNHYSVVAMVGDSGLTKPTNDQLHGIRDAIELLRDKGGAGAEIKGHRDGFATKCPGDPLQEWVKKGAPRPGTPGIEPPPPPPPGAKVSLSHVITAARTDPGAAQGHTTFPADVKRVEAALVAEGLLDPKFGDDGSFGSRTVDAYAAYQRRQGFTGANADGIPGKSTLTTLGSQHGFTVAA
ncbi:peptidoglycan-binding domain-containing protein [Streptomyces piniterrae]|uniref:Peptidoglycan-binding domain-containing protein n=1 Tax=Streptomyces piniterrae TaxID=2571125 RepID=A0A4U0NQS7_9ACTN|nr:peptidoglycan-binding domain-containing protein [Streptomyces piniterrae]TJZ56817.1 peptidoglycan-binding domain-containing protein [Streptomyces piniterrae]